MAAGSDAGLSVDRFEALAQTDIAEMSTSASATNEGPAVIKLTDLCEIDVKQLPQLVTDKDAP